MNSYGTQQSEYDLFLKISKPLTDICPIWPAKGNHERKADLFLSNFPQLGGKTYYSLVYDNIRFIILDSTALLKPGTEQNKWLQSALTDSLPAILILHHPIFSSGHHGDDLGLQFYLPQMLQGSQVKAVFSAHDHDYERSLYKGLTYIVTGGGGAPLRDENHANKYSVIFDKTNHYIIADRLGDKLIFKVYALDDRLIDSFELAGF
ncbi:MAG: metallophosphoesterase [Candidatus Cloacimonas sp.]|nr:metallophosphoesterase [Candidatus Cloacimonas sp.]